MGDSGVPTYMYVLLPFDVDWSTILSADPRGIWCIHVMLRVPPPPHPSPIHEVDTPFLPQFSVTLSTCHRCACVRASFPSTCLVSKLHKSTRHAAHSSVLDSTQNGAHQQWAGDDFVWRRCLCCVFWLWTLLLQLVRHNNYTCASKACLSLHYSSRIRYNLRIVCIQY